MKYFVLNDKLHISEDAIDDGITDWNKLDAMTILINFGSQDILEHWTIWYVHMLSRCTIKDDLS